MVRLLTKADLEPHFRMETCLDRLEVMYEEWAKGRAITTANQSVISPVSDPPSADGSPTYSGLKSMSAVIEEWGIGIVRINSDVIRYPEVDGTKRREKVAGPNGRYTGLVLVFDTATGEPLALFPDGYVKRFRVAADSAIGAKYLSRPDATTLGVLGTGEMARTHLLAYDIVRDLEEVYVFSPTAAHRDAFVDDMDDAVDPAVRPVGDPESAFQDADIVQCATNSSNPVFQMDWIEPGTSIGIIRASEAPDGFWNPDNFDCLARDYSAVTRFEEQGRALAEVEKPYRPWEYYVIEGDRPYPKLTEQYDRSQPAYDWSDVPGIGEIIVDESRGRSSPEEITGYYNSGSGLESATMAKIVVDLVEEEDIGQTIPTELLTQEYA